MDKSTLKKKEKVDDEVFDEVLEGESSFSTINVGAASQKGELIINDGLENDLGGYDVKDFSSPEGLEITKINVLIALYNVVRRVEELLKK